MTVCQKCVELVVVAHMYTEVFSWQKSIFMFEPIQRFSGIRLLLIRLLLRNKTTRK